MPFWRNPITLRYNINMSKRQVLMVLGIWIMIFLFISFPATWDKIFALITGMAIIVIAFKLPPQIKASSADRIPYVENKNDVTGSVEASPRKAPEMNDIIKADSRLSS